jgi:hypothetical protein
MQIVMVMLFGYFLLGFLVAGGIVYRAHRTGDLLPTWRDGFPVMVALWPIILFFVVALEYYDE